MLDAPAVPVRADATHHRLGACCLVLLLGACSSYDTGVPPDLPALVPHPYPSTVPVPFYAEDAVASATDLRNADARLAIVPAGEPDADTLAFAFVNGDPDSTYYVPTLAGDVDLRLEARRDDDTAWTEIGQTPELRCGHGSAYKAISPGEAWPVRLLAPRSMAGADVQWRIGVPVVFATRTPVPKDLPTYRGRAVGHAVELGDPGSEVFVSTAASAIQRTIYSRVMRMPPDGS